ncbi:3-ketosteroid-9-alpha-hydroxylase [Mycolicibacterium sp. P9-64]|uniref:ferredoxin--NADP reductase n=1 Tax=Mycolicibacterium sp. P9-64 TaxID=2024612 RepID=UPI0011EC320B|nr:ferredoxin--NADP reductase [Mycolicibacterium sp. P9-64]KAA0084610.1 3-ketosteroid-9-alpha-hydroxylase [Mycolicibacterium sp. P9-64]
MDARASRSPDVPVRPSRPPGAELPGKCSTAEDRVVPSTSDKNNLRLSVIDVIEESHDARSLVFAVPEEDRHRIAYRPGQFLTLRVPADDGTSVARCYSLASSPHTDTAPKVTVKRVPGGYGSNWLCDNITAGDVIEALPPSGLFTPTDLDTDLLMWAAGSGITPIMSILKSALQVGTGQVSLIYCNRDERSVIFAAELRELASTFPDRLTVVHWLKTVQGRPHDQQLMALARRFAVTESFICGPAPFMSAVQAALYASGAARKAVHTEVFRSLSGDPFGHEGSVDTSGDFVTATVDLDGHQHSLRWPRKTTLVDAMISAGIDVPYSCREGQCGSCAATVRSGEVDMPASDILEPEDLESGLILGCQATPTSDDVHIEF